MDGAQEILGEFVRDFAAAGRAGGKVAEYKEAMDEALTYWKCRTA